MCSALKRYSGGEQNDWRQASQRADEPVCAIGWQMLGDLERQRDVEAPAKCERLTKIARKESVDWDLECFSVHVIAVDPQHIGHAMGRQHPEPRTDATTDVDRRPEVDEIHQERRDYLSRTDGSSLVVVEKFSSVWRKGIRVGHQSMLL
jgi:hypothetical protein